MEESIKWDDSEDKIMDIFASIEDSEDIQIPKLMESSKGIFGER